MKFILVAITIAILGSCLNALPTGHLRVARSDEAAKAGTTLTVEKVEKAAETKDAAAPAAAAIKTDEPLKIEDALTLVKKTVQKLETDSSAPEAPAVAAKKDTVAAAVKHEEKAVERISSSASIISVPDAPTLGSIDTNDEATFSAYSQKYVNKYGDVLNRINQDKVQQLASSRRSSLFNDRPSFSSSKSRKDSSSDRHGAKTLSSYQAPQKQGGVSNSMSNVFINGVKVDGSSLAPKKLSPLSRYSANPYGESASLLSRQKNMPLRPAAAPGRQWGNNNIRVLSYQPQNVPMRFY